MTEPSWTLLPSSTLQSGLTVWREWPDGKQESRLVSSITPDDTDYANIMQLVAEGKLTIAPASP